MIAPTDLPPVTTDPQTGTASPAPAQSTPTPVGTGTEIASTLNSLNNTDYSSLVLARRMASLQRQNPTITASLAMDTAAGLNDTTSNTLDLSPQIPPYAQPNALSVLVHNALSNTADLGAVTDLQGYQSNLQALGYLPADYNPDGTISQQFTNASYQYTSDVAAQVRQGKGRALSVTANDALRFLGMTMPSGLWKTVVGMAHGLAKSMSNTAKDVWIGATNIPALLEGESGSQLNDKIQAATGRRFGLGTLGEDAMNVLTIASMATGLGELGTVLGGVGDLGAVAADQGLAALIKPVPGESGVLARSLGSLVGKFGGDEAKDSVVDFFGRYGTKALARAPLMETVGRGYGALRWSVLPQAALATFEPHSTVGRAAAAAKAPWWVDLPVMAGAVEPGEGIVTTGKRLLGVNRIADAVNVLPEAYLGLPRDQYWTNGQRMNMAVGAYAKAVITGAEGDASKYAGIGVRDAEAWDKARQAGGLAQADHFSNQMAKLVNRVVDNPDDPVLRQLDPAFAQEATAWADKHPAEVAAHYMDVVNSAHFREANGLMGSGEWDAYDHANRIADEATRMLSPEMAQQGQQALFAMAPPTPPDAPAGTLAGEAPRGRVLAMRADNAVTRESLDTLAKRWDVARNGVRTPDGTAITPPSPADQMTLEQEIVKLPGMASVPTSEWSAQLAKAARNAPQDVGWLLPQAMQEEMAATGYKAVLGQSGVILPTDLGALVHEAPKMSRTEYALSSLGLNPTPVDGASLVLSTQMARANEYAAKLDPARWGYGTGERMMQSVFRQFSNLMGDRSEIVGEGATKVQRMVDRLAKTVQVSQGPSQAFIRGVLEGDQWGLSPVEARMMGRSLFAAMKDGAAAPGLVNTPSGMLGVLHTLAAGMRVNGLPGVMDTLRSFALSDLPGVGRLLPDHYGYLTDSALKLMTSMRFQLNPLFELRKLTKGEAISHELEGLSPSIRPWKAMQAEDPMGRLGAMDDPPTGYTIGAGAPLVDRYSQIFTRTQGQDVAAVSDIDKAFKNSGVFGYNLQHHAIYDVGRIWDKTYTAALDAGKTADEATTIADTYAQAHGKALYSFGGKSPLMRSANFVFFPLSFESKAVGYATDYLTSQPVRLFVAHELARRMDQMANASPGQKSALADIVTKYAPVMNDVAKLNPFRFGISPGEVLGLYRPLADSIGVGAEDVANLLHPGIVGSGQVESFKAMLPRVLPGLSAASGFFKDLNEQMSVATNPTHESNQGEIQDYYALKAGLADRFGQLGRMFGTDGSISSFSHSTNVPAVYKVQYQQELVQLQTHYPAGALHQAMMSNTAAVQQASIDAILSKTTLSTPERAIASVEATRLQAKNLYTLGQKSPIMKHMALDIESQTIRAEALRQFERMSSGNQVAFNNLWNKLGYRSTYGPLAIPLSGSGDIGVPLPTQAA